MLCKNDRLVIPKPLQRRAVGWYHHYLQHPGHTRLEENIEAVMYWTGMRDTIRKHVKTCRSCQINKKQNAKYGKSIKTGCIETLGNAVYGSYWTIHAQR